MEDSDIVSSALICADNQRTQSTPAMSVTPSTIRKMGQAFQVAPTSIDTERGGGNNQ